MKTKITFKNLSYALFIALTLLLGINVKAQTYVYNETISSGMWFQNNGSQVSNPVSDAVNSSANCAASGTAGNWQQIQYFPTYSPANGTKLFFSVYNPNNAGPGQIQFEYTSAPGTWQFGGNATYTSGSVTGWVEYSIDLTSHVGNEINKIIFMPAGDNSSAVYIDNIYFGTQSVLSPSTVYVYNETISSGMWFQNNGSEVSNPVSDAVNSSANCAASGTAGNWQQIQYFPTYSPANGTKLFFSVYNPNNAGPGQIQFEYTSAPGTWQFGGNATYTSGSVTGWVEYSIDLTSHVGNEINKIIFMPAGDNSSAVYIDNIYFGTQSVLPPSTVYVYNETISSGMWFQNNGSEVSNPVSDAVNSSANCAASGTAGNWQQIQYFPTYSPANGTKLFFSVYNPNNAGPGQIQFEYTSAPGTWQFGGNPAYTSGSVTGWVEYSIDLTSHVGNEINKIIFMPAGDNSSAVYIDNIYFGATSVLSTNVVTQINDRVYISREGHIHFNKEQTNTQLTVFDLEGRLILEEKINGNKTEKVLNNKGIYIIRIQSNYGISAQKVIFN